jgi:hypothetical protein
VPELKLSGRLQPFEKEYFRKDGTRVPVLIGIAALDKECNQGVAFALDLTERKRAEAGNTRKRAALPRAPDGASTRQSRRNDGAALGIDCP